MLQHPTCQILHQKYSRIATKKANHSKVQTTGDVALKVIQLQEGEDNPDWYRAQ
jgi:hypothetical protein